MEGKGERCADPPDGGWKVRFECYISSHWLVLQAWLVMVCSFIVNGVVFSIINTFGILFVKLKANLEAAGDEEAAFKCSLVGSLAIGSTFFLSFLAGVLTDRVGLRTTAMTGALLATLGLALSATYHDNISVLCLTFGIMFGTGSSLIYTPSLSVLGTQDTRSMSLSLSSQVYTSRSTSELSMGSWRRAALSSLSSSASSTLSSSTSLG